MLLWIFLLVHCRFSTLHMVVSMHYHIVLIIDFCEKFLRKTVLLPHDCCLLTIINQLLFVHDLHMFKSLFRLSYRVSYSVITDISHAFAVCYCRSIRQIASISNLLCFKRSFSDYCHVASRFADSNKIIRLAGLFNLRRRY